MKRARDYMNDARRHAKTRSDYALAKLLAVSEQSVNQYRTGKRIPDNDVLRKVAELEELPLEELIASAEIERAQREGDTIKATAWEKRLKALGQNAAAVACAWLMAAAFPPGDGIARAETASLASDQRSGWDCGMRTANAIDALTIIRSAIAWLRGAWRNIKARRCAPVGSIRPAPPSLSLSLP
jgi:transcriptional regulator with XRE-family HTH domain